MNGVKAMDISALIKEHLPLEQIIFWAALDKDLLEDKWKSILGFFKVNKKIDFSTPCINSLLSTPPP